MGKIAERIQQLQACLTPGARLVAISKYHPASCIEEAYAAGQRVFGESHVQELMDKQARLPQDIEWHFIGHLQTNKVKYIAPFVSLIHAVDTEKLLREINRQGERCGRIIPCLLQLHVAQEETKYGFSFEECEQLLTAGNLAQYPFVEIQGLMCMASNTNDEVQVRSEFHRVHAFFMRMQAALQQELPHFKQLSMGMSHDYALALEEGSTLIRVGSLIFGDRVY